MRLLKIAIAIGAFVALGFTVERIKVSLNHYLDFGHQIAGFDEMTPAERDEALKEIVPVIPYDYYFNHRKVPLYHNYSLRQLTVFKWLFAAAVVILYLIVSHFFWGWMNGSSKVVRYIYICVAIGLVAVGCFFALSRLPINPEASYAVARKLLGFLHSPLPLLLSIFTYRMHTAFNANER